MLGLVISAISFMASPVGADHNPNRDNEFLGDDCVLIDDENSVWDGWYECTIAQPEGDHATHGKAYYQRTTDEDTDEITFAFVPDPDDLEEVQICITDQEAGTDDPDSDGNPYTPTDAGTCSGQDDDAVYDPVWKSDEDDYDDDEVNGAPAVTIDLLALFGTGFEPGDPIWFAVHINVNGQTNYITGGSRVQQQGLGGFTVSKTVVNDPGTSSFSFTVDCGAYDLSATNVGSADVTVSYAAETGSGADSGDNASFSLADDDDVAFVSIPSGTVCAITEAAAGNNWSTTVTVAGDAATNPASVTVVTGGNPSVAFTNTYSATTTRSLTVSKNVIDGTGTFSFTVNCGNYGLTTSNTGTNNGVSNLAYNDGVATFTLAHGGSITFTGIADDTFCTVTEANPGSGWSTKINGNADADRATIVDLSNGNGAAAYENTFSESGPTVWSLTVTKDIVNGDPNDTSDDSVSVLVECTNGLDQTLTLGHNGSETISDIPNGTKCSVTETPFEDDVAEEGSGEDSIFWNETVDGRPGTSTNVVLSRNRSVDFVNTRTIVRGETEERPPPPPPPGPPPVTPPGVTPPPVVTPPTPNVQPNVVVKPNVVERPTAVKGAVLARTGTETKPLLFSGFAMILAGAGLVFATRRPRTNPIA